MRGDEHNIRAAYNNDYCDGDNIHHLYYGGDKFYGYYNSNGDYTSIELDYHGYDSCGDNNNNYEATNTYNTAEGPMHTTLHTVQGPSRFIVYKSSSTIAILKRGNKGVKRGFFILSCFTKVTTFIFNIHISPTSQKMSLRGLLFSSGLISRTLSWRLHHSQFRCARGRHGAWQRNNRHTAAHTSRGRLYVGSGREKIGR